jgi:hypothetical protein
VRTVARVPGESAFAENGDAEDRRSRHCRREAGADDLDLGKLRHAR